MTIIYQLINAKRKFVFDTQKDSSREEILKEAEKYLKFIKDNEIIPTSYIYDTITLNPQSPSECDKFDYDEEFYYRKEKLIKKQSNLF